MKFFFDNHWPPPLARALNVLTEKDDDRVVHIEDSRFGRDATDEEWITGLAEDGDWVVVTKDKLTKRGSKGRPERLITQESGLTAFLFAGNWNHFNRWEQSWRMVRGWPKLREHALRVEAGHGWMVPQRFPEGKGGQLIPLW